MTRTVAWHWAWDRTGGFIVASRKGHYSYAFYSSPLAIEAAKNAGAVAEKMATKADADFLAFAPLNPDIYVRNDQYMAEQMDIADPGWRGGEG